MMLPPTVPARSAKRPVPMQWTASNDELGNKGMRPSGWLATR